ncbi:uncharacterized protein BO96DRAFT_330228 [Aspergillus niger CBS 101883]|uniref:uncharacterized protein n=1 Tax=Aspergillus lacticoffeatus (strain CBS 101883) TaxID=1450533 RepID=UPI000D7FFD40|nr:uncharacterized protein BO96DRAFT_330228 [Aspergillus niger CBS 101883]PYH59531.1 hypothetical protein BO96DRAFT_330228 [Aspergillus niger CBS 101883]
MLTLPDSRQPNHAAPASQPHDIKHNLEGTDYLGSRRLPRHLLHSVSAGARARVPEVSDRPIRATRKGDHHPEWPRREWPTYSVGSILLQVCYCGPVVHDSNSVQLDYIFRLVRRHGDPLCSLLLPGPRNIHQKVAFVSYLTRYSYPRLNCLE